MTTQTDATRSSAPPATPVEVRQRLVEALELDLVGPPPGHVLAEEKLRGWERPSNWYLTGFLVPVGMPAANRRDDDADDTLAAVSESDGLAEENASEEDTTAKKGFFPSSIGVSALVPAGADHVTVSVTWGDYEYVAGETREEEGDDDDGKLPAVWQRIPRAGQVTVPLGDTNGTPATYLVPQSGGLEVNVLERPVISAALDGQLPDGTRSLSLFLVNRRPPASDRADQAYAFQAILEASCAQGFVPRPDLRGALADEWDDQVADLHYADSPEYAAGHGVAADWKIVDGHCETLRTRWLPRAQVEKTEPAEIEGVQLGMLALGALADGEAARSGLGPLVIHYREWIAARRRCLSALPKRRRETAEQLLAGADLAAERIEQGIAVLASGDDELEAFRIANRAVARALQRRLKDIDDPAWRPFQLAFLLLNVASVADGEDAHRETVDLLYFPTGGGKTEAYLGLSAFAIALRRLRGRGDGGRGGSGVSVIMRYTLRLLTLDQLARAAGLVCALELEREAAPERLGSWPIEIGLWIGKAGTPNYMGHKGDKRDGTARQRVRQFQSDPRGKPSPIPLEDCPWCGTSFAPESFTLLPDSDRPRELRIVCTNLDCEFNGEQSLPIVAIDEPLYRRLPAFLIATVDKFASLPWFGQSGALLGGADRYDAHGFLGPAEPKKGTPLSQPLASPDLVIQDELHLISGPLGTMAALYETAIDGLCQRPLLGQRPAAPKIIASTATARRAQDQIQALFGRSLTQIFPPPGPDRRDSFFAETVPASRSPARLYMGVAAQGRNPKVVMRRVWLALMGAAELAYREAGGHENHENPADPYMTVLGYFNSLRELGGARRIIEEEVRTTVSRYGERRRIADPQPLFRNRTAFHEVVELTSRVSTAGVAAARRRLDQRLDQRDWVDCAIATNMISVGLDVQRLGLMGVIGQPKTASEYIQATSRVGRSDDAPGLVVTLLNVHKPRDRSHLERFRHFHETFYRSVEVGSVTPFAARALDRGFPGALLTLARHALPPLTPPLGAEQIEHQRTALEQCLLEVFKARVMQLPFGAEAERQERLVSVQSRIVDLLDSWRRIYADLAKEGVDLEYQRYEDGGKGKPLMREMLDTDFESEHHRKFRINRSLRGVEPSVNLFIKDLSGGWVADEP